MSKFVEAIMDDPDLSLEEKALRMAHKQAAVGIEALVLTPHGSWQERRDNFVRSLTDEQVGHLEDFIDWFDGYDFRPTDPS